MKKLLIVVALSLTLLAGCSNTRTPEEKIEKSNEIMEEEGIEATEKDEKIIEEVVDNKQVEYSYVTHHEETVMLKIKFTKDITDEDKNEITGKYMDKLAEEYPDKNINLGIIPHEED